MATPSTMYLPRSAFAPLGFALGTDFDLCAEASGTHSSIKNIARHKAKAYGSRKCFRSLRTDRAEEQKKMIDVRGMNFCHPDVGVDFQSMGSTSTLTDALRV